MNNLLSREFSQEICRIIQESTGLHSTIEGADGTILSTSRVFPEGREDESNAANGTVRLPIRFHREKLGVLALYGDPEHAHRHAELAIRFIEFLLQNEEQRLHERVPQENPQQNMLFVELSPEPIVFHDRGIFIYLNPAGVRLIGASSAEEVLGRSVLDFMHPDYRDIVIERIRQNMEDGKRTDLIEEKVIRLDGNMLDVEAISSPIEYEGKRVTMVMFRDITARKQAERRLEESEQRYKSLFEQNSDLVISLNLNGQLTALNPAAVRVTGYEQEDIFHQPFDRFIAPEDREMVWKQFQSALQGYSNIYEVRVIRKNGDLLELRVKGIPILLDEEIVGLYVIAKDITDSKRTEELLRRSDKLSVVGQLAAGIGHEIRNPLTSIRGFMQLMQSGTQRNDLYFEIVLQELDRINSIVSEFMMLAKPQCVTFEHRDLGAIVKSVVSLLAVQANMNNIEIVYRNGDLDVLPLIRCEENQLKQALINVVKNAIEATESGGSVSVEVYKEEADWVTVRVIDKGCGIPEERLLHLGEPFYTTKEKGTGLGLMVTQRIVDAHNGKFNIHSELDHGTTIEIVLPVNAQPHRNVME